MFKYTRRYIQTLFSGSAIIPWMMLASIIPMLLITNFSYRIIDMSSQQAARRSLGLVMQKKVEQLDDYVSERKLDMIQISTLPNLINDLHHANVTFNPLIEYLSFIAPVLGISNMYLVDENGKVVFTLMNDAALGQTLSINNDHYKALFRAYDGTKMLRIPYLYTHVHDENKADLYLSNVIRRQNEIQGTLILKLNLEAISRILYHYVMYVESEETFLGMEDDNNVVVLVRTGAFKESRDQLNIQANVDVFLKRAVLGETGYLMDKEGQAGLIVFRYVPQLNMGVLSRYSPHEIFSKVRMLRIEIFTMVAIGLLIVALIVYMIGRSLWEAHNKSDQLLEQMLPKFVVDELKEKEHFIARNVDNISVIFMDIVNFTEFASSRPPEFVVEILDELFSIIDSLCDKYQLEKIKTIGDAHLSAAGLIYSQPDHASRAINMGLDAILAVQHFNIDHHINFALKVGVDSGTITGGVIGQRKFTYDIWGNVVNRASRMESTGIANTVQITTETYAALRNKEEYKIILREGVQVKGLGEMNTYLVEGRIIK